MKIVIITTFALFAVAASLPIGAVSQEVPKTVAAPKYRMELVTVFDANPRRYNFVVTLPTDRKYVINSVESLMKFISTLPRAALLEWDPSDTRTGDEPLLSSEKEMAEFKACCQQKGVQFIIIPGG